uniref:hypothetical protein n=1 Tax=Acinetobacter baumannii TaxID=470 RepID=UPI0033922EE9
MPTLTFEHYTQLDDIGHCMSLLPLGSARGRTTSGMTFHLCPWTTHTVERRRVWHIIIYLGHHKQSNDVKRGMPS